MPCRGMRFVVGDDQWDSGAGVQENVGSTGHAGLSLIGESELADGVVTNGWPRRGRDDEAPVDLFEVRMGQRLDPDPRSITHDLDGSGREPKFNAKPFGNHHSSGTINGCLHA